MSHLSVQHPLIRVVRRRASPQVTVSPVGLHHSCTVSHRVGVIKRSHRRDPDHNSPIDSAIYRNPQRDFIKSCGSVHCTGASLPIAPSHDWRSPKPLLRIKFRNFGNILYRSLPDEDSVIPLGCGGSDPAHSRRSTMVVAFPPEQNGGNGD